MSEKAIAIHDVTVDFGKTRALDGLALEVSKGSIFGFLGPNGAGKTTTINILLGLLSPTSGNAQVLGFDTQSQADQIRTNTGALLDHTGLYEHLSAVDNLEFYGRVWHMPAELRKSRIRDLLEPIGLWDRRNESVGSWSRGMKQKLAIARVLLHKPQLVLLDEPTAGLDVLSAKAIRDDLEVLTSSTETTVFMATHNMTEAERLCAEVAVIRMGKVVAIDNPESLRTKVREPQIEVVGQGFTGEAIAVIRECPEVTAVKLENNHVTIKLNGSQDAAPLIQLMVENGIQIEEVRKDRASLEEAFLSLMEEE